MKQGATGHRPISRVQYLGAYEASYARHRIVQQGLRELGVEIAEYIDRSALPGRWLAMARRLHLAPAATPVIVGEMGNYLTPVLAEARRLGRPLVFDPFVSLLDTLEDRAAGWRRRLLAAPSELIDRLNNWCASALLFDTPQTRDYFVERLGLRPDKAHVAYVGAETGLFQPRPPRGGQGGPLRILFYGTCIPLQGIDVILRAARIVQGRTNDLRFQIVGDGQVGAQMRALAVELRLENVSFGPLHVPYAALPELIAQADLCLGIFANRPKTMRVIPNKLYQCAAVGRAVVTADTPAVREGFGPGELATVPPGDPEALAELVLRLGADEAARARLAAAGARAVQARYSPRVIGAQVLDACRAASG